MTQLICGVDVSSASLDARVGRGGAANRFANTPERHALAGAEIGSLSNKAVSKLAGLAPLAQDSGKHQGKRAVRGGRSTVREILFVVAGIAGRYEPDFMAFRQRLLAAGKPPKVIRIALAHKLLVRLNAKARDVRRHNPQLLPTTQVPALT